MGDGEREPGYLESLTDEELLALPPNVIFFLRHVKDWMSFQQDIHADRLGDEINDTLSRHHDLLILRREGK